MATFQRMARKALDGIYARGRMPIVTGGTGFYIQALLYGVEFEENPEDSPVRRELYALAEKEGEQAPGILHAMLRQWILPQRMRSTPTTSSGSSGPLSITV